MARMSPPDAVRAIVDLWADQTTELGRAVPLGPGVREPGRDDGRLEPAPARPDLGRHGPARPGRPRGCDASAATSQTTGRRLLLDYVDQERAGPRVVVENDDWLVVVPFWAAWPFETLVIAKRPTGRLADLDGPARDALGRDADRAPQPLRQPVPAPVPVLDGLAPGAVRRRTRPITGSSTPTSIPPLLRSATVRKFMVGYELLAESQRDLTAEEAAERLRAVVARPLPARRDDGRPLTGAGSRLTVPRLARRIRWRPTRREGR